MRSQPSPRKKGFGSSKEPNKPLLAHLSAAIAVTIFGLTFVAIKIALRDVPPFTIALIRFAVASVFLFPLAWRKRCSIRGRLPWAKLTLMGLCGITSFFILQNLGLVYTSASNASLILASIPAVTVLLAAGFLGERLTRVKALGVALTMVGVVMIILSSATSLSFSASLKGELMIFGSAISWAIYTIVGRSLVIRVPSIQLTAYSIFIGTAFLTPFSLYEHATQDIGPISIQSWVAMIFLGMIASGVAFLLYNYSLNHLEAGKAATYVNLSPFVTILAATLFLDEKVNPMGLLGGALIIIGIFATGRRLQRVQR